MRRNITALTTYLTALAPYLSMPRVTDICINREREIWVEQDGHFRDFADPNLSEDFLWHFARLVAEYNERELSPEYPLLSAVLPNGLRCQFVVPPACEQGSFICAIRQRTGHVIPLSHYFNNPSQLTINPHIAPGSPIQGTDSDLLRLYWEEDYEAFLVAAIASKKNIVISGGTSTGKTTLLNALLDSLAPLERVVTIETDREVTLKNRNVVHLLASEGEGSLAVITMLNLLKTTLRLRPDRIFVSEIREYQEAYPYLRAVNSGHPGSLTTIHADSAASCFDQLAFMMLQGGSQLPHSVLVDYAKSIIHIVVQVKRKPDGTRFISEIYFDQAEHYRKNNKGGGYGDVPPLRSVHANVSSS